MARKLTKLATILLTTTIVCGVSAPAFAQLQQQTGIADPGRVGEQLQEDFAIPQLSPDIAIPSMQLQGAPAGAEKIVFKFGGLRIEGASAYTEAELAPLYKDQIGQEISLADVYDIANKLTLKYRNEGYILTQVVVPPQTIENGIPRLQVVEGFIDKVALQGDGEGVYAMDMIRTYAAQIKNAGPVNTKSLERQLLIINDQPGVKARSILSPSKTTQGAADLVIIVERKPYDALLSVDNYGSRYLGPTQVGAAASLNSMLGLSETITGQFVITPDMDDGEELVFGSLGYEMPVGPWGTRLGATASITSTDPGFDLRQFDVNGRSDSLQIKATHPFIRARATNLIGRAVLDMRNVKSSNNVEPSRTDHVRALRLGMRYDFLDKLLGAAFNTVDLEISKGLDIIGGSNQNDPNLTRPLADPGATKGELEIQRLQRITDSVNLLFEGNAQLASDALLASEEFGLGGFNSVRGYDPSEVVGDDGIRGHVELQWKNPGNWQEIAPYLEKYQLYTFFDAGTVWNIDNTTSDQKRDSLVSTGLGARVNFTSGVSGGAAVAFPLSREVQTQGDHDPKFYFNLNKQF